MAPDDETRSKARRERRGTGQPGRSRRDLLAGAATGALGTLAASALVRADPAQAAEGQPVIEGQDNAGATSRTGIFTAGNSEWAILADPNSSGKGSLGVYGHGRIAGVLGESVATGASIGVHGVGGLVGVQGDGGAGSNGTGVVGYGTGTAPGVSGFGGQGPADGFLTCVGVFGSSNAAAGVAGWSPLSDGVYGESSGYLVGSGVHGVSNYVGNGVFGEGGRVVATAWWARARAAAATGWSALAGPAATG